ncbi:MAG TPA: 1-deoxy-D-xylulose-5-phosphate reductoisomerase [Candidatus Omnitrophota bacterium]|nr:1-deoxy-D-xylulose-5-phosphate reductoisomerase [Candidatus Omnitrophota bacterium]
MKRIAVIGSTGSIGVNTLRVAESHPKQFRVEVLAAGRNGKLLFDQIRRFQPSLACLYDRESAEALSGKLRGSRTRIVWGDKGLREAAGFSRSELAVFAMVGAKGLVPLVTAIQSGKDIAFANKEPFVIAGELIRSLSGKYGVTMVPIDSELSAIFQCLQGRKAGEAKRIILTSSGGPFRKFSKTALSKATVREALRHPRWKMGRKITIDSATLMNKALEVIETANFFDVSAEKVEVLIHPEAIVHSLVEWRDGSHLAQLGVTDMRLPIQYAMSYPERLPAADGIPPLRLEKIRALSFEKPDRGRFPCLRLGYEAQKAGGTMPAVLNAANEVAVDCFLNGKISFTDIPRKIGKLMRRHRVVTSPSLEDVLHADRWARENFS